MEHISKGYGKLEETKIKHVYIIGSKGIPAKEEDKRLICEFYKNALVGLVKTWLDSGMKYDPEQIIRRTGMLFDGNIKVSLERSAGENT